MDGTSSHHGKEIEMKLSYAGKTFCWKKEIAHITEQIKVMKAI